MRAAVLMETGKSLELLDVELDEPQGAEVVVEVRASGICHSDIVACMKVEHPDPIIPGHEVAGVVTAIGPAVRSVKVGDHVVACEIRSCGHCDDCILGRPYMCTRVEETERAEGAAPRASFHGRRVTAFSHIGGFATSILLHEHNLVVIDDDIPFDIAAVMGCGVVTGAGAAINAAGVRVGDTVAVIGCGGVGLSAIAGAAIAGARRVIAIDLVPGKLELARAFGATDLVDASAVDPVEAVLELTGGVGVLHAFECAGAERTVAQAMAITRTVGDTHLIGIQPPDRVLELNPFHDLLMPKRSLRSVYMGSSTFRYDIPLYLDFWRQGRFPLDLLVGRRIGLGEVNDAFSAVGTDGVARTVITSFG